MLAVYVQCLMSVIFRGYLGGIIIIIIPVLLLVVELAKMPVGTRLVFRLVNIVRKYIFNDSDLPVSLILMNVTLRLKGALGPTRARRTSSSSQQASVNPSDIPISTYSS